MEQQILNLINLHWVSPGLDLFMAALSSYAFWLIPIIITVTLVAIFGGFKARSMLLLMAIAVGLGGNVMCEIIKRTTHRPRPREMLANVRRVELLRTRPAVMGIFKPADVQLSRPNPNTVKGHSFPSSHAYNNFCVATILALFYRRRGWLFFIPAVLVAYSRVYVGAHWPSDVIAGAFLGCGFGFLTVALFDYLWRTRGSKILPKFFATHPTLLGPQTA